jgi:hypothetical protein
MVAEEPEDLALGVDGGFVVEGAVAKVKGEAGGDVVTVSDLNEIAGCESGSFHCLEDQEAVEGPLSAADRNRIGGEWFCCAKADREGEKKRKGAAMGRGWNVRSCESF